MIRKIFIITLLLNSCIVYAGNQQYEVLQAETQQMMASSVSDIPPELSSFENKSEEIMWIANMNSKLIYYIPDTDTRINFLKTLHYESKRAGLEPELILGLIKTESSFNKYALSPVGARGYMQIMPFWIDIIGKKEHNLFHLRTNLRYGCTILRYYLNIEHGNLYRALGRYNGSTGKPTYPTSVVNSMKKFIKD